MSESAQGAYTVKTEEKSETKPQLDDRNDPPTVDGAPTKEDSDFVDPVKKEIGETVVLTGGRDYDSPRIRVIPSTYHGADDNEKALYISQGKNMGISLSLGTLEAIIKWAKGV